MNSTTSNRNPRVEAEEHAPGILDRFCRRQVLSVFKPLRRGSLSLRMPDGQEMVFGGFEPGPQAEVHVRDDRFFRRCVAAGDVGFGESYVAGEWDTPDIASVISWFLANTDQSPSVSGSAASKWRVNLFRWVNRIAHRLRANSLSNSRRNIHEHYDLGNEFYALWLDSTMTYSSGLFLSPELTLEQSQLAKYDALCRKLKLCASDHLLEIGTGWGGFACHAASRYGCRVTTVTISEEQHRFALRRVDSEGLAGRIDVRLQDYRSLSGSYDKIASIEMLEAVGDEYLEVYFAQCDRLLKADGLLGLQFINSPDSRYDEFRNGVDWIQKHIFPGSLCPSIWRVGEAIRNTGDLFLHHLDDFGLSYARTLREGGRDLTSGGTGWNRSDSTPRFSESGTTTWPTARPLLPCGISAWCRQSTRDPTIEL